MVHLLRRVKCASTQGLGPTWRQHHKGMNSQHKGNGFYICTEVFVSPWLWLQPAAPGPQYMIRCIQLDPFTSSAYLRPRAVYCLDGTTSEEVSAVSERSRKRSLQHELDFFSYFQVLHCTVIWKDKLCLVSTNGTGTSFVGTCSFFYLIVVCAVLMERDADGECNISADWNDNFIALQFNEERLNVCFRLDSRTKFVWEFLPTLGFGLIKKKQICLILRGELAEPQVQCDHWEFTDPPTVRKSASFVGGCRQRFEGTVQTT